MSAAPWAAHFGLSRTPFGKSIAARDLFPRQAHAEAIAQHNPGRNAAAVPARLPPAPARIFTRRDHPPE